MYQCGMKQIEERHVANQVDLMVWSNKLDLLAVSNAKGEVTVHRLQWQKVWSLSPPKEGVLVQAMAWRPDGKALAIGYNCGSVCIVDIEDKEILNKYELEQEFGGGFDEKQSGITCITWAVRTGTLESATEYNLYDDASIFLQKLPSLSSGYKNPNSEDSTRDFKEIQTETELNLLIVSYGSGFIYMSVFGRYSYGTMHLCQIAKHACGEYIVLDISLSDDFSLMQIIYLDITTNSVYATLLNTSILSAFAEEIFQVANKHGQIVQQMTYLDQTMVSITEAWEHILLEMDKKMAYYADTVAEGGVSADLLELLMMGNPSHELEIFLLRDLTTKGLKKFGNSIELSYSTIQKLVLKQLNIVVQSLTYYLAELRGLIRISDRYDFLGLDETAVTEAIKASCAFLNKCLELQQVIDVSMRNYKSFFRWLFVVLVRYVEEPTPSEIVKITQQDLTHIAEFLYNFDNVKVQDGPDCTERQIKFNLEKLGQYLQDQELKFLPDDEDNPWHKFLKENACVLKDDDTIFSMAEFKKFSLVQQQNFLKTAIIKLFDVSDKNIYRFFTVVYNVKIYEYKGSLENNLRVSQMFDHEQNRFMVSFMNYLCSDYIYFMSSQIKDMACNGSASKLYFTKDLLEDVKEELNVEHLRILDLKFYSSEYLSVLVQHPQNDESTIFVQLPLKIAIDNCNDFNIKTKSYIISEKSTSRNVTPLLDQKMYKVLDRMDGLHIAVSGRRKVAVVLSKSLRRVRVFEMEVDDEDEEETLESLSHSHVTDTSQTGLEKSNISVENISF